MRKSTLRWKVEADDIYGGQYGPEKEKEIIQQLKDFARDKLDVSLLIMPAEPDIEAEEPECPNCNQGSPILKTQVVLDFDRTALGGYSVSVNKDVQGATIHCDYCSEEMPTEWLARDDVKVGDPIAFMDRLDEWLYWGQMLERTVLSGPNGDIDGITLLNTLQKRALGAVDLLKAALEGIEGYLE